MPQGVIDSGGGPRTLNIVQLDVFEDNSDCEVATLDVLGMDATAVYAVDKNQGRGEYNNILRAECIPPEDYIEIQASSLLDEKYSNRPSGQCPRCGR